MRARRFVLALSALVQFTGDPATAQQSQQPPSVIVDAQTIVDLADTLTRRGKWSEARDAWQRVLSANPYFARGWYRLGVVERNSGNGRGAIRAFARYVELGGVPPTERNFVGGKAAVPIGQSRKHRKSWLEGGVVP